MPSRTRRTGGAAAESAPPAEPLLDPETAAAGDVQPDSSNVDDGETDDDAAPTSDRRTVRLRWGTLAAKEIRGILLDDLTTRGVSPGIIDEAQLVASELVANAVRHARPLQDGTVRIHWKAKGDIVEVEVSDGGGDNTPKVIPQSDWVTSGRGLRIVRSIAHEWGIIEDTHGHTVWACMGGPSRRRTQ